MSCEELGKGHMLDSSLDLGKMSMGQGAEAGDIADNDPIQVYSNRYMREPWRFPDASEGSPSLSLVMIARDEESTIARCLESVKDVADEIIVVDMGSTDRSVDIARGYGAKVYSHPCGNRFFEARNTGLDHATGDWVLFLEANEELVAEDIPQLIKLMRDTEHEGFYLNEISYLGEKEEDCAITNLTLKLWRNRPEYRFNGEMYEQALSNIEQDDARIGTAEIRVNHYAYLGKSRKDELQQELGVLLRESERNPDNLSLRFRIGVVYLRKGDYEGALEIYKSAFADLSGMDIGNASRLVKNISLCLKSLGRYQEALKVLRDAQEAYPDYADLYYIEGLVHLEQKNLESAVESFKVCLSAGLPGSPYQSQPGVSGFMAACKLAKTYMSMGSEATAQDYYKKALESNPRYSPALLDLGLFLMRKESPDDVRHYLEPLVDLTSEPVLSTLSFIFTKGGHYAISLAYLQRLADMGSSPSQTALLKGECLLNMKCFQEAITEFDQVVLSSEYYPAACANKSACYLIVGEYERAIVSIDLIKGIDEFSVVHSVYRFAACVLSGQPTHIAVDKARSDEVYRVVADLMRKLLELNKLDVFEKVVALLGGLGLSSGECSLFLGKIYYDAGYNDIAAEELIYAYESGNADGEAFFILGRTAFDNGFFEEAKTFFFEALHRGVDELSLFVSLGYALIKQGEITAAIEVLDAGSEKYPGAPLIDELRKSLSALVCAGFST